MEDFKYYTLFGVRLRRGPDMIPEYSRDFILRWTTNEREASVLAKAMVDNKMMKTSVKEAIEAVNLSDENYSLFAIGARMRANIDISAHLVETDFALEDSFVDILIQAANAGDYGKKQLAESRIKL